MLTESTSETPIETDWLVEFFENAKNVSDDDMQTIWAKILAGEINSPGTCSPRTLHLLKQMGRKDALLFAEFCEYLIVIENHTYPCFLTDTYGSHDYGFITRIFNQEERLILAELGLVNFKEDIFFSFKLDEIFKIIYNNKKLIVKYNGIEKRENEIKTIIQGYPLTRSGKELYNLCHPNFNEEFWSNLKLKFKVIDFEVDEES